MELEPTELKKTPHHEPSSYESLTVSTSTSSETAHLDPATKNSYPPTTPISQFYRNWFHTLSVAIFVLPITGAAFVLGLPPDQKVFGVVFGVFLALGPALGIHSCLTQYLSRLLTRVCIFWFGCKHESCNYQVLMSEKIVTRVTREGFEGASYRYNVSIKYQSPSSGKWYLIATSAHSDGALNHIEDYAYRFTQSSREQTAILILRSNPRRFILQTYRPDPTLFGKILAHLALLLACCITLLYLMAWVFGALYMLTGGVGDFRWYMYWVASFLIIVSWIVGMAIVSWFAEKGTATEECNETSRSSIDATTFIE